MRQTEQQGYNPIEQQRSMMDGLQARIWTSLPGIVQSVNLTSNLTAQILPAIKAQVTDARTGIKRFVQLPLLNDCPILFPGGGGYLATFPLAAGDEVLINIACRCIDAWWQSGGVQQPIDMRFHDLSDGFCIPKLYSVPSVPSNINTTTAQLRSFDGSVFVEIDKPNNQAYIKAPTQIVLDAPLTVITGIIEVQNSGSVGVSSTLNGSFRATGEITTELNGGISLSPHYHSNSGGSGNGGPPVPGS